MTKKSRLLLFIVLPLAVMAAVFQSMRGTGSIVSDGAGEPEVVAATFSSAWCSSCKVLKPRLAKVAPEFAREPVRFVEYDFTFGEDEKLAREAQEDGLGEVYARFKGATGFTLLVDAQTGEIIDTLTMNHSEKAMSAALDEALAVAQASS